MNGGCASLREPRNVFNKNHSWQERLCEAKERPKRIAAGVGEPSPPAPRPLRRLGKRLARRPARQNSELSPSESEVTGPQELGRLSNIRMLDKLPFRPVCRNGSPRIIIELDAPNGLKSRGF